MTIFEYVTSVIRSFARILAMKALGLGRLLRPFNQEEFIHDWHSGMTWPELKKKYRRGSDALCGIASRIGLPPRHYGPIPAKELEKWGAHYAALKPLITKDYIAGVPISEIMKKYKIGHQTFMPYVRKYVHKREANKLLRNKQNQHITKQH